MKELALHVIQICPKSSIPIYYFLYASFLRSSTSVSVVGFWLMIHKIFLKLRQIQLCQRLDGLKPSLSTKILSINDFITRLLSKLLRDLSNRVHLKSISKFINKVINRYCFCKWTLKNRSIYKNTVC